MNTYSRILIIDDELQIRKLLNISLSARQFKVIEAINGREAISFTGTLKPDAIILDLGLPDISGLEVLREIRTFSDVPIIILSVQDESEVIVQALDIGADDYVTKPFEPKELAARINVCLRRTLKKESAEVTQVRGIRIDLDSRLVFKDGQEVKLTSTEYDLLKFFLKNPNKILTNRQILKEVWGPSSVDNLQYPRVYIRHLRQKLEKNPDEPILFITESGVGYRFKTEN
ncbi:MAG: response regulator transcription factor [Bacteriovoracaceae bacterium]|nr:response regulator transcription factor [Bacteriovoracaceae bacterium]